MNEIALPVTPAQELTTHHDGSDLTKLSRVLVNDDPHPTNGANHVYILERALTPEEAFDPRLSDAENRGHYDCPPVVRCGHIAFQRGPLFDPDSTPGTTEGAVLAVLIHRFEAHQAGEFACDENVEVLRHLQAAMEGIKLRRCNRQNRGVLGTNEK